LNEVRQTYETVRGKTVRVNPRGSIEELEKKATANKEELGPSRFWEWHRLWFYLFCVKGTWNLSNLQNTKFPVVNAQTLEEFLRAHPEI